MTIGALLLDHPICLGAAIVLIMLALIVAVGLLIVHYWDGPLDL